MFAAAGLAVPLLAAPKLNPPPPAAPLVVPNANVLIVVADDGAAAPPPPPPPPAPKLKLNGFGAGAAAEPVAPSLPASGLAAPFALAPAVEVVDGCASACVVVCDEAAWLVAGQFRDKRGTDVSVRG